MSTITTCPYCATRVIPMATGLCPSCGKQVVSAMDSAQPPPQPMLPDGAAMKATVRTPGAILRSMSSMLPLLLMSIVLYGLFFMVGIVFGLQKLGCDLDTARIVSYCMSPLLLILGLGLYFRHLIRGFRRYALEATNSDLTVAGFSGFGFVRQTFLFSKLAGIQLGKDLNVMDRFSLVVKPGMGRMVQDLKMGTMVIILDSGKTIEFTLVDKAFERQSLIETLRFVAGKLPVHTP